MTLLERMVCHPPSSPTDASKAFILSELDLDPRIENIINVPVKKYSELRLSTDHSDQTEKDSINNFQKFYGLNNLLLILSMTILSKTCLDCFVLNIYPTVPVMVSIFPSITVPHVMLITTPFAALLVAFRLELLLSQQRISWRYSLLCHLLNIFFLLAMPALFLSKQNTLDGLLMNLLVVLGHGILAMKLYSYFQVNRKDRRRRYCSNNNEGSGSSRNVTLQGIVEFWATPSLVYNLSSSKNYALSYSSVTVKLISIVGLQFIARQGMSLIPNILRELMEAMENEEVSLLVERFLTLSLAFNFVWMTAFLLLFLVFCPLLAEICGSEEIIFFHSWWNAASMEEFWRWWNLPVRRWFTQHIYVPIIKNKFGKLNAFVAVFLMSALLHEYLISCPLKVTGHFAFVAFLGQPPLIQLSEVVKNIFGASIGNMFVWSILIFGNSYGTVIYYKEVMRS